MAVSMSIHVEGLDVVKRGLGRMSPKENTAWVRLSLIDCGELTQKIAAEEMIIRGGRFRGAAGPRGGKGKMMDAPPHPTKLTSRSSRLRDSIRVNHSPLPWAVDVGSDVVYAPVHELGGKHHPPRPYLAPALDKAAKSFDDIFMRRWKKEMPK